MDPKIETYISNSRWKTELQKLREIILDCGLTEEVKWNVPCYTFRKANVVVIGELKECCVLSFFKGVLLHDEKGILVAPGNNTQSARIARFTGVSDIVKLKPTLKAYIYEAIEVEKTGLKPHFKKTEEYDIPEEFERKMQRMPALKKAFQALTPGRQRAYLLHFAAPKQSKTREARIEKCVQQILEGKGLNEWSN